MGWSKTASVGDQELQVVYSSTGAFRRHLDTGNRPGDLLRLSGKRLRATLRRTGWDDLTDDQRDARLHRRA
jgi:hypothetical protein